MTSKNNKNENMNVRITASVKRKLLGICKKLDRSQGWVISDLIEKEYDKQNKKKKQRGVTTMKENLADTLLPFAIGDAEDVGEDYDDYAERLTDSIGVGQLGEALNEVVHRIRAMKKQHDIGEN